MKLRLKTKFKIFILFNLGFLQTWCFAVPSEHLLINLTRNAVDVRKNGLPILLTDKSKNAAFRKVIQETLNNVESETYEGADLDRAILSSFLRENVGLDCSDCDQTVHQITKNLLFRAADPDLGWMTQLGFENPSYRATLARFPEAIISHGRFSKVEFFKILATGRLGFTRQEVAEKASSYEKLEMCSHLLRGYGPSCSNGTFFQISENQSELDLKRGTSTPRIILKNDLLKRWDFYVSSRWPGGRFVTQKSHPDHYREGKHSFGPGEMDRFIAYLEDPKNIPPDGDRLNELVFLNPIPISEIREIQVNPEEVESYRKIVDHFHLNIPVRGMDLVDPVVMDPGWKEWRESKGWKERDDRITRDLNGLMSGSVCSHVEDSRPEGPNVQETELSLQPIVEKLLSDSETRARFESLDPRIQKENLSRLRSATQTKDLKYLDPKFDYMHATLN